MVKLEKQDFLINKVRYENILKKLREHIEDCVPISHVGSTAIPNMVGKNIIDVLVGAKVEEFEKLYNIIVSLGYMPSANSKTNIYQFFASQVGETSSQDTHIHLVVMGTERYNEFLILKNYLLANTDEAKAYANYKKEIVTKITTERKEYRRIKSIYVEELLKRAKEHIK